MAYDGYIDWGAVGQNGWGENRDLGNGATVQNGMYIPSYAGLAAEPGASPGGSVSGAAIGGSSPQSQTWNLSTGIGNTASPANGNVSAGTYGNYSGAVQNNPYLQQQMSSLTAAQNLNLQNNLAGINSTAQGNGSYGSNRQGIAQGTAVANAQTGLNNTLANLGSSSYQYDVNAALQQQQLNNSLNLGLGQINLGYYNGANSAQNNQNSFYTAQRGQDLQALALGSSLYNSGIQGNLGLGQGMSSVGSQYYNAPNTALGNYSNVINQYTGLGGSTVNSGTNASNPLSSALGGAVAGNSLASLWSGNTGAYNASNDPYSIQNINRISAQGSTPYL